MKKRSCFLWLLFLAGWQVVVAFPSASSSGAGKTLSDSLSVISPEDSLGKKKLKWAFQLMSFARSSSFEKELGSINPENRIAQLNSREGGLYLRLELEYTHRKFEIKAKPRYNIEFQGERGGLGNTNYSSELYLQQLKAKWQLSNSLSVQTGRYIKLIGTSIFINPSNPFFTNPGRLNPKLELRPMDFLEVNYSTKVNWNFSLVANVNGAQNEIYQEPFLDFKRTYAFLVEYFGESENMGLVVSIDEAKRAHLGNYGQKNASESILVWYDVALDYGINRFYPQAGHYTELLDFEMVNGSKNNQLFFSTLLGASYTLNVGPTIQLEYFYSGKGYCKQQLDDYYSMITSASNYNFDITRKLADMNLGRSIHTGLPYIRNHYLFLQASDRDVFNKLNYNFRYLLSADDGSSQLSTLIEFNLFDSVEIFGIGLKNFGGRKTDLNKLLDHQAMVGLLFKF